MAQLTRNVRGLITASFKLIGELGDEFEEADAPMLQNGLEILNEILDETSGVGAKVPYISSVSFTMVAGQSTYSISNLVSADVTDNRIIDLQQVNITRDTLVYPITIITRAVYDENVRQTDLQTIPAVVYLDVQAAQSNLVFYPAPDQAYPITIKARLMLNSLAYDDDLNDLPPYFYGYLKFALARELLAYYPSGNWPQTAEDKYQRYVEVAEAANHYDLSLAPSPILNTPENVGGWQRILAF